MLSSTHQSETAAVSLATALDKQKIFLRPHGLTEGCFHQDKIRSGLASRGRLKRLSHPYLHLRDTADSFVLCHRHVVDVLAVTLRVEPGGIGDAPYSRGSAQALRECPRDPRAATAPGGSSMTQISRIEDSGSRARNPFGGLPSLAWIAG